ncbi:MAG: AraC family transcriptional regulator [Pseudomonadota bacterium]
MKTIENVSFIRDPEVPGIEISRVVESSHRFPRHFHDDIYGIGLMEKGASYCMGPEQDHTLVAAGNINLINPGQVHSGVPAGRQVTYTMMYVTTARMTELSRSLFDGAGRLPEFRTLVVDDPVLFMKLKGLMNRFGPLIDPVEKESALVEAFTELLSAHGGMPGIETGKTPEPGVVSAARDFLSDRLEEKISLTQAAEVTGLSRYHFLRVFRKQTGLPPHTYRTIKRVDAARRFLKQGMPPAQVALETGFSDQSHFTTTFRQYLGVTPKHYLGTSHALKAI